jgi:hypothetical protein
MFPVSASTYAKPWLSAGGHAKRFFSSFDTDTKKWVLPGG